MECVYIPFCVVGGWVSWYPFFYSGGFGQWGSCLAARLGPGGFFSSFFTVVICGPLGPWAAYVYSICPQ